MRVYILLSVLMVLSSCNQSLKKNYEPVAEKGINIKAAREGKKLMEQKCYVCHSPSADHDSRIAPPMVAIKSHYLNDNISKEDFADAIWNFVQKPTEGKSKMRGAVRRFG